MDAKPHSILSKFRATASNQCADSNAGGFSPVVPAQSLAKPKLRPVRVRAVPGSHANLHAYIFGDPCPGRLRVCPRTWVASNSGRNRRAKRHLVFSAFQLFRWHVTGELTNLVSQAETASGPAF